MNKYENSVIYIIKCKNETIKDCYIGSTTNFTKRKIQHKECCNNENSSKYHYKLYQCIRDNSGWANWNMEIIVEQKCKDKKELRNIEGWFMKLHEPTLNQVVAGRTQKQYYQANKEKLNIINKQYYENNKEKMKEKMKQYNEVNKEKIQEIQKQYRESNKEELKENNKQWRTDNKEKIEKNRKIKITCECGSIINKGDLARHKKSKKCINFFSTVT